METNTKGRIHIKGEDWDYLGGFIQPWDRNTKGRKFCKQLYNRRVRRLPVEVDEYAGECVEDTGQQPDSLQHVVVEYRKRRRQA